MIREPVITVIGLGKLGAPIAATLAARGLRVRGVDNSQRVIGMVNAVEPPVDEPGLRAMMEQAKNKLSASRNTAYSVANSDISFILVPTPSADCGEFSIRYVLQACEEIGKGLSARTEPHVVVVTSTVMPGHTGGAVRAELERASGKMCGQDFGLCYSPEFVALGTVIEDFLNPDFLLIGEGDQSSGDYLEATIMMALRREVPVCRTSLINAEIAKLALNAYLTMKISYANTLAQICEHLPGANVDEVSRALGLDSRIGAKYLKGGLGFGGPCFPRDTVALSALTGRLCGDPTIPDAVTSFNLAQTERVAEIVCRALGVVNGKSICVMGVAYKPGTPVITESQSIRLIQLLSAKGLRVTGYDPIAQESVRRSRLHIDMVHLEEVAKHDVIVVAHPDQDFRRVQDWSLDGRAVVDCWRLLDPREFKSDFHYIALGKGAL